jgi:hypothetical protein
VHVLRVSEDEAQRIRERLANEDGYEIKADRRVRRPQRYEEDWQGNGSVYRIERPRRRRSRSRCSSLAESDEDERYVKSRAPYRGRRGRDLGAADLPESTRIPHRTATPRPSLVDGRRATRGSMASHSQDINEGVAYVRPPNARDYRGRALLAERSGARSRSQGEASWEAPFGGRPPPPGNRPMGFPDQLEGATAKEDYDWYDSHGQRVRVREI